MPRRISDSRYAGFFRPYRDTYKIFLRYWKVYGGLPAIGRSPYLHFSLILLFITSHFWLTKEWWSQVIGIIPSLLGFTVGGFAILVGVGDDDFKSLISGRISSRPEKESPYLNVAAAFAHFSIIQFLSLLSALIASATFITKDDNFIISIPSTLSVFFGLIGSAVGYWLFLYGLTLTIATVLAIFRVASWFDEQQTKIREQREREREAGSKDLDTN